MIKFASGAHTQACMPDPHGSVLWLANAVHCLYTTFIVEEIAAPRLGQRCFLAVQVFA